MNPQIHDSCLHEEQIQGLSRKTAELEAHAEFKEQRINELIEDNKRIETKIDNLTETINKVMLNSIKDDNNINQRVTALETQQKTRDKELQKYKEEARKERDEDRANLTLKLAFVTIGLTVLSLVLTFGLPFTK